MKKFLLSFCMLAVASVCVFMTSCKDDDEEAMKQNTTITGNVDDIVAQEIANGVTYSFVVNGTTYNSWDDVVADFEDLPAGTYTIQVIMEKDGETYEGEPTTFTIPTSGSVVVDVDIPTSDSEHSEGATFTINKGHGGGAAQ
ncbi:MAG: hypothetical protein K6A32_04605 [Bacteroidales bacterium]|nr:hypothetical protein [Bacteroidales bacterium]